MSLTIAQAATPTVSPPQLPLLFGDTGSGAVELCCQDRQDGQLMPHHPIRYRRLLPSVPIPVDCLLLGDLLLSHSHALIRARPPKVLRNIKYSQYKMHSKSFSPHFFLPPVSFLPVPAQPPRSSDQKGPDPSTAPQRSGLSSWHSSHIQGVPGSMSRGW